MATAIRPHSLQVYRFLVNCEHKINIGKFIKLEKKSLHYTVHEAFGKTLEKACKILENGKFILYIKKLREQLRGTDLGHIIPCTMG